MKVKINILIAAVIALCATFVFSACNKKFDEPPFSTTKLADEGIRATKTIDDFKNNYATVSTGGFLPITDSIVLVGVVSANDRSGNLYKQIYIQDSTGGIEVDIEGTGLYGTFPVGREVAIFCKGLYVANVAGMKKIATKTVQNGSSAALGIPSALLHNYVRYGAINQPVEPIEITSLTQLDPTTAVGKKLLGSLVKLNNYEVVTSELFYTYADSTANKNTVNVDIQNCSGERILFRNSAYANFASLPVPTGNGSITALYTVFNTTKQLLIRDTSDVKFYGPRCDGTVPGPPTLKTVKDMRDLSGTGTVIAANTVIEGVIVSNYANEAAGNYRIQDNSGYGIQLRFTTSGNKNFNLGDRLRVFVGGLTVAPFNGDIQINNVPGAALLGVGTVTPRVATIPDIIANVNDWASTVVKINNVTITPGSSSSTGTNYTLTDNAGNTLVTFVRTTMGYTPPASASSVTGYVSMFNGTAQLTLRQAADIQ